MSSVETETPRDEKSATLGAAPPALHPQEIALMFSGGIDSTATAILLSERFERVHLLTYKNGYGHHGHARTTRRVRELERRLGDRFSYSLIHIKDDFDELLVREVMADYRRYKSGFIWCMGCKLAMHTRSAIYCLENGLLQMSDGSNGDTDEMVEQMQSSLIEIRRFYESLSIDFGTPVYDRSRDESRALIESKGLGMGLQVLDRHLNIQPTCVGGELYYVPYMLFNKAVRHDEQEVTRFIQAKQRRAHALIRRHFEGRQIDLDALIADRRRQMQALAPERG